MNIRLLTANEIECRVGAQDKSAEPKWCTLLLYKDARCDYKILDEVFGTMGWQCSYETINGNLFCTIKIWDNENKQWVCKQNVGTESNTEKEKGEASDALKRAAFAVGIGRELYTAPQIFINLQPSDCKNGKITNSFKVKHIAYEDRKITELIITDKHNAERYNLKSKTQQAPTALPEPQPVMSELKQAVIKVQSAKNMGELISIWNEHILLQRTPEFKNAVTNMKSKLKA